MTSRKVVLFSGGMDSTTLLGYALKSTHPDDIVALSFNYGSLHNDAEGKAAEVVCDYYNVRREVITIPHTIFAGGKSALLAEATMPEEEYHDPETESPSQTIVPFRNGVLISIATARAEALGGGVVFMGAHANDAVGWAYPDCSPQFLTAMQLAVFVGTLRKVSFDAPFVNYTKKDIVAVAAQFGAPLHLTWSCYRGGEVHCGKCPTCRERVKAFAEAGYFDPVEYAQPMFDEYASLEEYPIKETK